MRLIVGILCALVSLGVTVWATDLPVTYQDCRTRAWPKVIFEGDTLGPGLVPDTIDVLVNEALELTVLMAVDDSSHGHAAYKCCCDSIEAKCDTTMKAGGAWAYQYWVKLFRDQPEPPDWTRQTEVDTLRRIGAAVSDSCPGPINACPTSFVMEPVWFTREGVGALVVRGRIYNYNLDYLAPAADTARIVFRVWRPEVVGTGARAMVVK